MWGNVSSVYVHSSTCETYLVKWHFIDLLSIGVGIHVSSVYVHSAICETYFVSQYSIDLLLIGVVG